MTIQLTKHAAKRIRQRVGNKSAERMQVLADTAFVQGVRIHDEAIRVAQVRILMRYAKQDADRDYVLYRQNVYVYQNASLITVLPLEPNDLRILEKNCRKQKRRQDKSARRAPVLVQLQAA